MAELAFIDSETRSLADLPQTGAYKYAKHPSTDASVWGFVFDDEPGDVWSPSWAWGNSSSSRADIKNPERLLDHVSDGGIVVAWNAFFDRHIWNEVMVKKYGWPVLPIEQVLCAQAQAEANNLPGALDKACECLGTPYKKDPKGRQLIQQLAVNGDRSTWNSEIFETPEKMGHFRSYCLKDCLAMRDVWQYTRPLTASEWDEYHASERINDRGVMVDVPFAKAAQGYALVESNEINADLLDLTGDIKLTVTNHVRKAKWLHDELWPSEELQELTKRPQKEPGKDRFSGDRATRDAVLEMIMLPEYAELFEDEHLDEIVEFIELIEAGNSAAVRKFTAIVNQEVDARVHGGYSFNGAGQTGRFCVDGHTLIETKNGPKPISEIRVTEKVWTHRGRLRHVVAKCTKGREEMFKIYFDNGRRIVCTAGHRILNSGEWQHVSEQNAFKRYVFYSESGELLYVRQPSYSERCRRKIRYFLAHGWRGNKTSCDAGSFQSAGRGEQIPIEDGPGQSDVRCSNGWRDTPREILSAIRSYVREIRQRTPTCSEGKYAVIEMAGWVGGSSHRRRPDQQRPRQFSRSDQAGPSITAQPEIIRVVAVGKRTVWDITVDEDSSYIAEGIAHHNSSRGIQVHNLIRSPVEKGNPDRAIDAIEDIMNGEDPEFLVDEYGFPVSRLLARLIRPTFIAPEGKTLVWADWDQIEARVLPWLSNSQGGDDKLDIFRSGKDVYKYAAQPIFHLSSPDDADDHQRQVGKVAELALGFGGAVGAFSAMGRGYGVIVPPEEARSIVTTWRANNSWCVNFWHELWDAAMAAFNYPGEWYRAGRVRYLYHPNLMRGTLICELPDGRWIVYPQFQHERVQYECKKTTARHTKGDWVDEWRTSFVKGFGSGYGRVDLWYGTLAENITQATAASFLRRSLAKIHQLVVLHTHDEIVCEVNDDSVIIGGQILEQAMTDLPDWAEGLPLSVTVESGPFYTK